MLRSRTAPKMKSCLHWTAILVLLTALPAIANDGPTLPMAKAESVGMSSERLARINAHMQQYIDNDMIAGAVTLVARKGKVIHLEAQGSRYREENIPMTTDTIFTLASMTKPIASTALMMLFEEGLFRLDDPISKWLPEYKDHKVRLKGGPIARTVPEERPVTVRHVLTHTSGLTFSPEGSGLTEEQRREATNDGKGFDTLAEQIEAAAVIPGAFHPGDHWQYGVSTDYVAILVEKISGESLDDFLRERIFEPLGMVDTHYNVPRAKVDRLAAIYEPNDDGTIELMRPPKYVEPTRHFRGVTGLKSTPADYFRFAQMIANGGELDGKRIIGRMTVDNMITNHIGGDKLVYVRGPGYGFGLGFGVLINPAEAADALSVGSYTWGGAYGTLYWADPAEDLIGLMFIQVRPYTHIARQLYSNVVTQAVVDSLADQKPKIMGYATPR